jgi:hypothetical protein
VRVATPVNRPGNHGFDRTCRGIGPNGDRDLRLGPHHHDAFRNKLPSQSPAGAEFLSNRHELLVAEPLISWVVRRAVMIEVFGLGIVVATGMSLLAWAFGWPGKPGSPSILKSPSIRSRRVDINDHRSIIGNRR